MRGSLRLMSCCDGDGSVTQVAPPSQKSAHHKETLTMTHEAAEYIADLLARENKKNWGLKIEVIPGGCAGYKYFMQFQEKAEAGEKTFEFHGVKIFLSLMSVGFLKGSAIEFVKSLEATGLKINNPNMTSTCGCGKSFG